MKRIQRPAVTVLAMALVSGGLAVAGSTAALAAAPVLGPVTVTPTTGNDSTGITVSANAACPAGTDGAFYDIKGADIGEIGDGTTSGSGDVGFLGEAAITGPSSVPGNSIANLKSTNAGAFSASGAYKIRLRCQGGADILATYEATLNYTAGGAGAYTIAPPPVAARATATVLTASPSGSYEAGTLTTLTADVTPTSGADNPTGSVAFYDGTTLLGTDNSPSASGAATLAAVALGTGGHSLTAVYVPADATFTGSTSPAVAITVTPVSPRATTSVITATPTSGPAYSTVTLTCAVSSTTGAPNGTAVFKDGAATLGSVPVSAGAPANLVVNNFAAGDHTFSCAFTGVAPYTASTSDGLTATYDASAVTPDPQTVTVVIPTGALTITTPYDATSPLALGNASLDAATSTYQASAPFTDITITDNRPGDLGWTASVQAGAFSNGTSSFGGEKAGLTGLVATQVSGNALLIGDLTLTSNAPVTPGLASTRTFASYPTGKPFGTAKIAGTFGIAGVPTSVTPGTYTSTVVFTAA
jgi:hypothetical protein